MTDISSEHMQICLNILQQCADHPASIQNNPHLIRVIAKIYKSVRKHRKQQHRQADQRLHAAPASPASDGGPIINRDRPGKQGGTTRCYSCKQHYKDPHFFYSQLCVPCAAFNYEKRFQRADLTGRCALITGGRIKIGYQLALRMLRDGARVIVTTRFQHDAARRFQAEHDFDHWHDRLKIYGLDLRNIPALDTFIKHLLREEPGLDILVNNAAQTIKRPLAFYQSLIAHEQPSPSAVLAPGQGLAPPFHGATALLEARAEYQGDLLPCPEYFPADLRDEDGQQVDLRPVNSWILKLGEISAIEMLEVQLANVVAPFMLNSQLKPLMLQSGFPRRFIINVSAMEGQFNRANKTVYHPHTNMAKAALNMMTRTAARDYAESQIFMNSVDTGWITDENPVPKQVRLHHARGSRFSPPLDVIDGAARIYDPIVRGLSNPSEPLHGHFLKDYVAHPW
ncbi:MAG TPA: SDR family oxidoreductase [Herpetosiphonaceae bacterium]|nr:SDR family oxidoreductase [Herpetosiphonaceae bacterium]